MNLSNLMDYLNISLSIKAETVFLWFSGLTGLSMMFSLIKTTGNQKYHLINDLTNRFEGVEYLLIIFLLITISNFFLGALKLPFQFYCSKFSFNKFLFCSIFLLFVNFCMTFMISDYKSNILENSENQMLKQLRLMIHTEEKFGVGYSLADDWNFIQTKLFCCGVLNYKDYYNIGMDINYNSEKNIPISCCVKEFKSDGSFAPMNYKQCNLDAKLQSINSVFLYTEGCHLLLNKWFLHQINRIIAIHFLTNCFQTGAVIYMSFIGYRRLFTSS